MDKYFRTQEGELVNIVDQFSNNFGNDVKFVYIVI